MPAARGDIPPRYRARHPQPGGAGRSARHGAHSAASFAGISCHPRERRFPGRRGEARTQQEPLNRGVPGTHCPWRRRRSSSERRPPTEGHVRLRARPPPSASCHAPCPPPPPRMRRAPAARPFAYNSHCALRPERTISSTARMTRRRAACWEL